MTQVTLLRETRYPHFAWHGAWLNFLDSFLIALIQIRVVNLKELAVAVSGKVKNSSHYKTLQRFFRKYEADALVLQDSK